MMHHWRGWTCSQHFPTPNMILFWIMQTGPRGFVPSPLQIKGLSAMWTNWIVAAASLSPAEQNEIQHERRATVNLSRLSSRGLSGHSGNWDFFRPFISLHHPSSNSGGGVGTSTFQIQFKSRCFGWYLKAINHGFRMWLEPRMEKNIYFLITPSPQRTHVSFRT